LNTLNLEGYLKHIEFSDSSALTEVVEKIEQLFSAISNFTGNWQPMLISNGSVLLPMHNLDSVSALKA
jgi:hypothetical protein